MSDLRPISLCNVIYRILTKALANWFTQVLQHVISLEQRAFLPNRLITDNAMIAFEVLHYMHNKGRRKRGWQAVKLDMSKAFDRVEWSYLVQVMRAFGFVEDWIRLIMACVTSVQYAVLLNAMIHEAERHKLLHGVRKSSITFSSNVQQATRSRILQLLGMTEIEQAGQYLGFLAHVGQSQTVAFSSLKLKFWTRLNEWREQPLSKAGREVLIKSVLQSPPIYIMGLFYLPLTLCSKLEKIMNRYWWGGGEDTHKIHWMEWRKLALPKKSGGLGFRAFHEFNIAMSELKPTLSLIWRSIWCSKELLKRGCRHLIGDGRGTLIWGDPWIPNDSQFLVQSPHLERCEFQYMRRSDGWTWAFTRNGNYTVRSGYHQAIHMHNHSVDPSSFTTNFRGCHIWVLNIPKKVRLLAWSAYRDILPTMINLQRKRVVVDLECPMCHMDIETVNHCFMACPMARAMWLGSSLSLRVSELHVDNFAGFFEAMTTILGSEQLELFCILCWKLWCCRNEALWEGKTMEPKQIIEKALLFLQEYNAALLSRGRGAASVQRRSETRWRPPDAGFVKINVDGAICAQRELYGLGAVARDSSGEVIAAMMSEGYGQISAEESEACSLRNALRWARDLMIDKLLWRPIVQASSQQSTMILFP
ncbi:hypothetical protein SLEP1_g44920 [Rubroshorea leprosula]|uniref:Reverse transcriptase domain-containing protein n=1 Tax=Rubroshorea leprosula TaxID=152421 RepID=A0AAV5LHL8_9ROSI|nr:hypothetical protein SLEP1_g44920 [Rubroshorea leprosula]